LEMEMVECRGVALWVRPACFVGWSRTFEGVKISEFINRNPIHHMKNNRTMK